MNSAEIHNLFEAGSLKFNVFCKMVGHFAERGDSMANDLLPLLNQARVFVFEKMLPPFPDAVNGIIKPLDESTITALPFPVCFFEIAGMNPLYTEYGTGSKDTGKVIACLIKEESPNNYSSWCILFDYKLNYCLCAYKRPDNQGSHRALVKGISDAISTQEIALEKTSMWIRGGSNKNSRPLVSRQLNEIVRISPANYAKELTSRFGGRVDWSHQWEVRGHWRKINGIGKDRSGAYTMSGFTWV